MRAWRAGAIGLFFVVACGSSAPRAGGAGGAETGGTGGAVTATGGARGGGSAGSDASVMDGAPGAGGSVVIADAGTANADAQRAGAAVPPGTPVGLPLVVTDHYPNRGWFGDPDITGRFAGSSMIQESEPAAGPCAARPPGARGKCLRFVYTPPAQLMTPPTGGWVGDFFLGTLKYFHPEVSPTPRPGQANWGYEPAVAIPAGATALSFFAAAPQPVTVGFRAGIDRDAFVLPELTATLTPDWKQYRIPLDGVQTGWNLFGPFGWALRETGKAATFYVDGIVWEGSAPPPSPPVVPPPPLPTPPRPPAPAPVTPPAAPAGKRDGIRQFVFINRCPETVWVGAFGNPVPAGGGFRLDAGQTSTITVPGGKWTGRFWGRTGCRFDAAGVGACDTGACGARLQCPAATGEPPATLAEFTLSGGAEPDFYDLSLVDGYNLPMAIAPLPGTFTAGGGPRDCGAPTCAGDLNPSCPPELRFTNAAAKTVACLSACERFRTDEYCCAGAHATAATCPSFDYARLFKSACPDAYSYAYDDASSTYTCRGEDYAVFFCP
jgi:hypothetical protein